MKDLVNFVKNNADWKDKLKAEPYNLQIAEDDDFPDLYLFKYNMIKSSFAEEIVKQSRGIILEITDDFVRAVCTPFDKFFNFGEGYAAELDKESIKVQSKIDGSICKLYFYQGKWRIATNGRIDAFKTNLPHNAKLFFGDLIRKQLDKLDYSNLDEEFTYIFEFVSKWNKIVVAYGDDDIYHIGTRSNETGVEFDLDIGIQKPKMLDIDTLDKAISVAADLPLSEEGYVVVDKFYNRVKVKSPLYLAAHRLKGNSGIVDMPRIWEIVKLGESEEFLAYFPEYAEDFEKVEQMFTCLKRCASKLKKEYSGWKQSRKNAALKIQLEVPKRLQCFAYRVLDDIEITFEKVTYETLESLFS